MKAINIVHRNLKLADNLLSVSTKYGKKTKVYQDIIKEVNNIIESVYGILLLLTLEHKEM